MKPIAVGGVAALCTLCIAASDVRAQSMAVVGSGFCEQPSAGSETRRFREVLSRKAAAVQPERATASALGGVPTSSLADLERVLDGASKDFDQLAYERAAETLNLAVKEILALPVEAGALRCQYLQEGHLLLAWALRELHKDKDARAALERVDRVKPLALDIRKYPPSFRRFAEESRALVMARPTAMLSVDTRPSGLTVYVDGCPAGTSPLKLKVPLGEYKVEAGFPSGRGLPKAVDVSGDKGIEFDLGFEGSIYPDRGPCVAFGKERQARLAALVRTASLVGARYLVTFSVEEPAPGERYFVAALVDSATGQDVREARIKGAGGTAPLSELDKLAEWVATGTVIPPVEAVRRAPSVPAPAAAVAPSPPAASAAATGKTSIAKPLGYGLLGVGAAGLVVSGVFFAAQASTQRDINALTSGGVYTQGTEARVRDLESKRDRQRIWAGVCGGVGVLGAGAGAFTLWKSSGSSGSDVTVAFSPAGLGAAVAVQY